MTRPGDQEMAIAAAFDAAIRKLYPNGQVGAGVVAGGCATLMVNYFSHLEPDKRINILHEMTEAMIGGFHDHPDTDLYYLN